MKITTLEVAGIIPALKGMRNPKNSWHLNDSFHCPSNGIYDITVHIGPNDMKLCQDLIAAGPEHRKFLRQIQVWVDMDMPRYWWSEMDTYHHNTKNSCSTMHKLLQSRKDDAIAGLLDQKGLITLEQFVVCIEDLDVMDITITRLNKIRDEWQASTTQAEKDYCLLRAKRLLPEGFLQLRTVNTNYEEIRNIYFQRKHHRLKTEWGMVFCNWVESLPYAQELILYRGK